MYIGGEALNLQTMALLLSRVYRTRGGMKRQMREEKRSFISGPLFGIAAQNAKYSRSSAQF
jgi:hypothetical protein